MLIWDLVLGIWDLIAMGRRSRRETNRPGGFTLIEVVIALALLGIGLTVILELFSGGLRLARTSAAKAVLCLGVPFCCSRISIKKPFNFLCLLLLRRLCRPIGLEAHCSLFRP